MSIQKIARTAAREFANKRTGKMKKGPGMKKSPHGKGGSPEAQAVNTLKKAAKKL